MIGMQPGNKTVGDAGHTQVLDSEQAADIARIDFADPPVAIVVPQQVVSKNMDAGIPVRSMGGITNAPITNINRDQLTAGTEADILYPVTVG